MTHIVSYANFARNICATYAPDSCRMRVTSANATQMMRAPAAQQGMLLWTPLYARYTVQLQSIFGTPCIRICQTREAADLIRMLPYLTELIIGKIEQHLCLHKDNKDRYTPYLMVLVKFPMILGTLILQISVQFPHL
jgi:hypothetical protein